MTTARSLGSSNRTDQDQWDFSIRANTDSQQSREGQPREQYTNGYTVQPTSPQDLDEIERSTNNGVSKSSKSKDRNDTHYLSPYKPGLKQDVGGSRSGSEPDSLLDLYKQRNSMRDKSFDSPMPSPRHMGGISDAANMHVNNKDDDPEQSRWIHKDKLAEIERREMEAAGIAPPPARSKSRSRRPQSPEKTANGVSPQEEEPLPISKAKRRRVRSPPEPDQEEPEEQIETNDFDIRTPEEIAADSSVERTTSPVYRQQGLRSSSSRIPLPRSSPMPLPQEHLERNTPLPRKQGASGNWDGEDSILYHHSRSRGNSVGSQVLLDDIETPTHGQETSPASLDGSPTKIRTPSANKHIRKISSSTPASTQKPRSTSVTHSSTRSPSSTVTRPKSRAGLEPRPPTAINRPEGDAPWLKDMYKPDPMLPPEQQLLPTHAKRLQEEARRQEQWEQAQRDAEARRQARKEDLQNSGKDEGTRDDLRPPQKGFSPLAEYTANGLQPSPGTSRDGANGAAGPSPDQQQQDATSASSEWPLTHATGKPLLESVNSGGLPGTGDKIGNAGYSAMPRMRSGNEANGDSYRATVTSPGAAGSTMTKDPFEKERLARMEGEMPGEEKGGRQKKKESEGCCGCVVM